MVNVMFKDKISGYLKGRFFKEKMSFEVDMPSGEKIETHSTGYYDYVDELGSFAKEQGYKYLLGYTDEGHYDEPEWKWSHSILTVVDGEWPQYYVVEHEKIEPEK